MDAMEPTPFSRWIRINLKDAYSGLIAQDIDSILHFPDTGRMYVIEEKHHRNARIGVPQAVIYVALDALLNLYNQYVQNKEVLYGGCFLVYYNADGHLTVIQGTSRVEMDMDHFLNRLRCGTIESSIPAFKNNITHNLHIMWDCRGTPPIRKTEPERSGKRFPSIFTNCEGCCVTGIDWLFVNYCSGLMVSVNEVSHQNRNWQQHQLIRKLVYMLKQGSKLNFQLRVASNCKSGKLYRYIGHYDLSYEALSDNEITNVSLNGTALYRDDIIKLLNLECSESWREIALYDDN
ncbi:MAG: hypothetical protein KatS3mg023_3629 [Armatimonadota bacterium]|nr:MAG: hypothetical protein KatS3mg023_3629 [Armatimonadota bacterium]